MKLDLLKKLTALANNNPNDNEANLAARKVCLMLAEAKFIIPVELPKVNIRPQASWPYGPRQEAERPKPKEEPKTWNDVHRSEEPEFKSTYYTSNPTGPNPFEDFFRKHTQNRPPNTNPYQDTYQDTYDPFSSTFEFDAGFVDTMFGGRAGGGKTKGFKESNFKNYNPIDDTIEVSCIICKSFFRISKIEFEAIKGCYVCPECKGKGK